MTEAGLFPVRQMRLGVLTSGGDCAGLNAALRAVVQRAMDSYGWTVTGIEYSTLGLLERPVLARTLEPGDFDGTHLRQSGTLLGSTNRGNPFAYPMPDGTVEDRSEEALEGFRSLGLDGLIGIGGDGSLVILKRLADQGNFPLVCIPKTIDNDLGSTEVAVGFDTAVQIATEALDRLQPTAASHDRLMILEVMGRDAGHIALAAGIAGGADVILIPEIPYEIEMVARKIRTVKARGQKAALLVVAEAVEPPPPLKTEAGNFLKSDADYDGIGHALARVLAQLVDSEIRVTVLGHVQRGGTPSARDRLMASAFGVHAVDLLADGKRDCLVVWQNRGVHEVPIASAIESYYVVDIEGSEIRTARGLGINLGDM